MQLIRTELEVSAYLDCAAPFICVIVHISRRILSCSLVANISLISFHPGTPGYIAFLKVYVGVWKR